jgi:hypothetical protein
MKEKICTGCGHSSLAPLGKNSLGEDFLGCCPDSNYVEVKEAIRRLEEALSNRNKKISKMYTEQGVKFILESFRYHIEQGNDAEDIESFFEQFKKKDK